MADTNETVERVDLPVEVAEAPEDNYGLSTLTSEPIAYFKHKLIREFQIGPFHFVNSILAIRSEEELAAFRALITDRNVPESERAGIVEYHPELLAKVEQPLTATRGAQSTETILDPKRIPSTAMSNTALNSLFKKPS